MRLIDCEPLIEFCEEVVSVDWNHKVAPVSWAYAEQEFMDRLKEAPTIDAVPVVRCRECIHRTENGNCGHPRHEDTLPTAYSNDFCSYGERRAVRVMADCKWMQDEICVNADCPMRADYCPVVDYPGVCRYEEREDGGT